MQTTTTSTTGIFNLDPCCSPWEQRLNTLLSVGLAAGADLVEVFLERTDHLGVLAEQDKITSVSPAFGMGAGIRVFRGARDGFVSTNDLSRDGLTRALDQALAMLGKADMFNQELLFTDILAKGPCPARSSLPF